MKLSLSLFITITAITVMLCCAGCITAEEPPSTAITGDELEEYVHTAAVYAKNTDKDEALAAFADPNGPYVKDNLYIYAYDFNGTLLAHPYQPEKVGTDRTNWTTANGLHFVQAASDAAQDGSGYIVYMYPTPGEKEIDEGAKNLYEVKLGYVEQIDDTWWIGSGIYLSDYTDAATGVLPEEIAEMTAMTESAVAYAHENGTDAAITEIDKQDGLFTEGNLYIYAYDYNGTLVAHPYLAPGMKGTDLSGYVGPYGVPVIQTCADTAANGGGFVVFGWENPENGGASELKLGYVLPVDDTWWVGSGLYLSDIFGEEESVTGTSQTGRTVADVVDFVAGACDHADTVGKEQALLDFGDKDGEFVDGNLYLYVEDFNGVTLAHPIHPQKVGVSRLNATDPNGLLLVKGLCDTAAEGDGFFMFMYQDPADNFTLSPKLGYVKKAGDDWWVGSGVYLADLVDPATGVPLPVISGLTGFVGEAQAYAQTMTKDAALTAFRDPANYFADATHPIYAFSQDGVLLADTTRTDMEGTNLSTSVGEYGVPYVTEGAKMAENGGGFLIYTPQGEGQRLDYILPVDDDWWIGASVPVSVIVDESYPEGV